MLSGEKAGLWLRHWKTSTLPSQVVGSSHTGTSQRPSCGTARWPHCPWAHLEATTSCFHLNASADGIGLVVQMEVVCVHT